MRRIAILGVLVMLVMVAAPAALAAPDLIVESIAPNCGGYLFGNESNTISAVIGNTGPDGASASDASFVLSGGYSEIVSVPALGAGNNTTVSITDPTIRNAGVAVTITVTADCDGAVAEGNESNNATDLSVTVVNNGYKGKTYTGGPNMTTWKTYDLNGNLVYSAGDSYYLSSSATSGDPDWTAYGVSWTADDLPVPGTATIKDARLYVMYTWDKKEVMSNNVSVDFNTITQTPDVHYQDEKMFATSYPYGMLVYNVTDDFDTGGNIAYLTNSYPGGDNVSMRGMMLMVIYEDACELRKQIFVNEEFDMLYGGSGQCTTPDEATAWAPITGPVIMDGDVSGRLITFAPGADGSGSAGEGELIFNGQVWDDEWTDNEVHQIGISDRDVTSYLQSTGNLVGFQSNADYMEASNAILIVEEMPNATVYFEPSDIRVPKYCDTETVGVWINSSDTLGSGTIIFDYTSCCANVTDFAKDPVSFPGTSAIEFFGAVLTPGRVKIDFAAGDPAGFPANIPVRIGNMTIHCCNATDFCVTDLAWNCTGAILQNATDAWITPVKYEDGTFMCNIPDLVVTMVKGTEIPGNPGNYTVECTVKNIGDVNASESYASLEVDDQGVVATMFVNKSLAPNGTFTGTFALEINQTDDVDDLLVCADYNNTVVETDETNNCMIGRYPGEVVLSIQPAVTYVQPQDQFDVKVHVDTKGIEVYAVQYRLTYNTSVVRAETQVKGPFLGSISETIVLVNEIYQPHGEASYAETRTDPPCPGGVINNDNVSNIHFIAIGVRGATTNLTLDDIIISDKDGNRIAYVIEDGAVEITTNTPPVPVGVIKHRINNVAQKYQSTAILCSCSYDLDYPGKGGNISYIRWAFGDGQYGTSEGLPVDNCTCKEHRYESWQWQPFGVPYDPEDPAAGGNYVPFEVQLEVTDDGCPEITNNTNLTINVYIAGDANGDGEVNVLDAVWVGKNWREVCNPCNPYPDDYPASLPNYCECDPCEGNYWSDAQAEDDMDGADLNNDCVINVLDAVIVGANWRHTAW